jgi:hypothetical protein
MAGGASSRAGHYHNGAFARFPMATIRKRISILSIRLLAFLLLVATGGQAVAAAGDDWRVTLYGGPSTDYSSSQLFLKGKFRADAAMLGVAADRHLADLGWGFALEGEGQITHYFDGADYTTLNAGIGARFTDFPWQRPTSVALFTGPSWADDPPVISTGSFHGRPIKRARKQWLNYVGAEATVALSQSLNGVVRYYHRSGAFGLWADNADEGNMVGIGLQARF